MLHRRFTRYTRPAPTYRTDLSDHRANVIKLEHNQFKALDRVQHVQLEVTAETNGHEHIATVIAALEADGFIVNRIY